MKVRFKGRLALVTALTALLAVGLGVAVAAAATFVHARRPHNHAHYAVGARPHFSVKALGVNRSFHVFGTVASKRRVRHGILRTTRVGDFFSFHRHRHGRFTYTPPNYTFPSWYMQKPGRYYWQAKFYDVHCPSYGCHTRIRTFVVR